MKKNIRKVVAALLLIAIAVSLAACGSGDVYESLADKGYTVKIRFDAGGAVVNDTQNVEIVEVYSEKNAVTGADGTRGIRLLAPDDPVRQDATVRFAKTDGKYNYFQIGWYRERTPVLDDLGNPLDVFGELVSESGREPAYTYSGKWDFDNDLVDPTSLSNGEMTLYAAWAPFFTYEFYSQNESGEFEKIGSKQKLTLLIPTVSQSTGRVNMNDFPKINGKVYAAAYLDEALTQEISANLDGRTMFVNSENGTVTNTVVKVYVTWTVE